MCIYINFTGSVNPWTITNITKISSNIKVLATSTSSIMIGESSHIYLRGLFGVNDANNVYITTWEDGITTTASSREFYVPIKVIS